MESKRHHEGQVHARSEVWKWDSFQDILWDRTVENVCHFFWKFKTILGSLEVSVPRGTVPHEGQFQATFSF